MADTIAGSGVGVPGIAGTLLRDAPVVTVSAPTGPQATSTVTVAWSHTSTLSKPQLTYRVRIQNQSQTTTLYDSGTISGATTSLAVPYTLYSGSSYVARVDVGDGVDTGFDTSAFTVTLDDVADTTPLETVGSIYEAAINGVGLMLADSPQRPYKRSSGQMQAPRFATGDTPFSEAIDRYTFVGSEDWSAGAGQTIRDRELSDPRAFRSSENVDPFTPGELQLLNASAVQVTSTQTDQMAVVASGALFTRTGSAELKRLPTPGGTLSSAMTFPLALVSVVSDGSYWYAATTGELIYRGTSTTVGAAWSDLSAQTSDIDLMEWCTDRLAVVYVNGSGQSVLSTLGPTGTEEVAAGRFKYTDATITAVTAGDGYIWYAVNRTDRSLIYAWSLGSADAAFIALELPKGERVTALHFYLGNVMIRTAITVDTTTTAGTIYRAVPSTGELTPERIDTFEETGVDLSVGPFTGMDRFVFWGWTAMSDDGRSGVGALDLSTGGWCRWVQAPADTDTGAVQALFAWNNRIGFTVAATGACLEGTTPATTGYLESSVSDLSSSLVKVVDSATVTLAPLPASSSVVVSVSTDSGDSYSTVGTVSSAGVKSGTFEVGLEAAAVATKITLNAAGTSPTVKIVQVKLHPLSVVDSMIELPVDCSDRMTGMNGVEIQDANPVGLARARFLEELVGTRVSLQDVDWPITRTSEVWEVVSAELTSVGTYNRLLGRREETAPVCVVTLRRGQ